MNNRLSNELEMQMHIRKLQNMFNKADNEEIDIYKTLQQQKQEMNLLEFVRELETATEELKQMKASFEQEKKQYFKDIEEYTKAEVEKAITRGLESAFTK